MSTAIAAVALLLATSPGRSGEANGKIASEPIGAAADFLARAQADFRQADGSIRWRSTWAFDTASTQPALNAAGVVARALVAAGGRGDARALAAAQSWGRALLAELAAGGTAFDPDIEALAELGRLAGDPAMTQGAQASFQQRYGMANGREIVERLFWIRKGVPALVGYDASWALRAAVAVGERAKAQEIVEALALTRSRWESPCEQGFHLTSRGALLAAIPAGLSAQSDALRDALKRSILDSQDKDGAWGAHNTQATAYAVLALRGLPDAEARRSAARGARFLRATQLRSGGWATFNDFLPEPFVGETVYEVTAEAMLALF